jgi:hypothetical protein
MKRRTWFIISAAILFVLLGCSLSQAANPPTATPLPTNTEIPSPTNTALPPTNTPKPTAVPKVTVGEMEQALRAAGFSEMGFSDGSGSIWTLDNPFENIYTHNSGDVQLEVLNGLSTRMSHMETFFQAMDSVFPSDFMAQLRDANTAYAGTVGAGVTGKPVHPYGPAAGDLMKFQYAYYNVSNTTISPYDIQFSLFFEQWTCPSGYQCTFPGFGNQQFQGQASFVFYDVDIMLNP